MTQYLDDLRDANVLIYANNVFRTVFPQVTKIGQVVANSCATNLLLRKRSVLISGRKPPYLVCAPEGGPPKDTVYDEIGSGAPPWHRALRVELESEVVT